jgi:glycosyltransferase involved in cell wall biosynthesis
MAAQRILFVIMDLGGGAGVYCRILAKGLRKEFPGEFHLSLLTVRSGGFLPHDDEVFDHIAILPAKNALSRMIQLKRGIAAAEPACIICVGTFANLLVPVLAKRRRTILTVHGNYSHLLGESKWPLILRPLLRRRFAKGMVIAPSQGVADDLIAHFAARDVRVIHHGVDGDEIARLAGVDAPDRPRESYMLAVGRLARQKDYPTMLRAYAAAQRTGLPLPLVIVGDGPEGQALRLLAEELSIAEHVRFLGHRDNPFPYMKHAEFLLLSSRWEGFGLVLIEAMSLGVPCVSTDCPSGPAEILDRGRYGLLVPPGDPEKLAAAMLRMHQEPTRRQFADLAKARSEDFDLRRMAAAYRTLLRSSDTLSA